MIVFNYEIDFSLNNEPQLENWIQDIVFNYGFSLGEINYIFCDDDYLHKLNLEFLKHDTLTDVISFDNTIGELISVDIFISIERIRDNAIDFKVTFAEELHRVMIHGVLHCLGFKDKTNEDKKIMTKKENESLLFLRS